jgi:hypothetical protein
VYGWHRAGLAKPQEREVLAVFVLPEKRSIDAQRLRCSASNVPSSDVQPHALDDIYLANGNNRTGDLLEEDYIT